MIFVNSNFADMIARLRVAIITRKSFCDVLTTKFNLAVLLKIQILGLITNFSFIDDKKLKIRVYFKYVRGSCLIKTIELLLKPKSLKTIKLIDLKKKQNYLSIELVSTKIGILTPHECLVRGVGGVRLIRFN